MACWQHGSPQLQRFSCRRIQTQVPCTACTCVPSLFLILFISSFLLFPTLQCNFVPVPGSPLLWTLSLLQSLGFNATTLEAFPVCSSLKRGFGARMRMPIPNKSPFPSPQPPPCLSNAPVHPHFPLIPQPHLPLSHFPELSCFQNRTPELVPTLRRSSCHSRSHLQAGREEEQTPEGYQMPVPSSTNHAHV